MTAPSDFKGTVIIFLFYKKNCRKNEHCCWVLSKAMLWILEKRKKFEPGYYTLFVCTIFPFSEERDFSLLFGHLLFKSHLNLLLLFFSNQTLRKKIWWSNTSNAAITKAWNLPPNECFFCCDGGGVSTLAADSLSKLNGKKHIIWK